MLWQKELNAHIGSS